MLLIPCRTDATFYDFTLILEGKPYVFTFRWNPRGSFWTLSLSDTSGTPLITGRRVVCGFGLLARFLSAALPPGEFYAVDATDFLGADPGISELGGRVQLYYLESGLDVAARGSLK